MTRLEQTFRTVSTVARALFNVHVSAPYSGDRQLQMISDFDQEGKNVPFSFMHQSSNLVHIRLLPGGDLPLLTVSPGPSQH